MRKTLGPTITGFLIAGSCYAADLTVELTGIKSPDGIVLVQLFTDPAQFPDGTADREIRLPASEDGVTATFTELAPGTYAVGAYHDANENGKLDANFMGMPTEDVGNSGEVALAKPGFEKSSFELGEQDQTISFVLR